MRPAVRRAILAAVLVLPRAVVAQAVAHAASHAISQAVSASVRPTAPQAGLHVLRVTPADSAGPGAVVTVVFDAPPRASAVSGRGAPVALLSTGGGAAVPVRTMWSDPVTVRLVPLAPLAAGARYMVALAPGLARIDGGRLAGAARFFFRVRAPRLTASDVGLAGRDTTELEPGAQITLLYDAPLESDALARGARLTMLPTPGPAATACAGHAPVAYAVAAQRPVRPGDPYQFGSGRFESRVGRAADSLRSDRFRRVVELRPTTPVPEGCRALLAIALDPSANVRYPVRTAAPFALVALDHEDGESTIRVSFSAPVRREAVQSHLHVEPDRAFTAAAQWSDVASTWELRTTVAPHTTLRVVADSALRDTTGRRITTGARTLSLAVPGRTPRLAYNVGLVTSIIVGGVPTVRVRHVNVARAELVAWPIPDSLRARLLTQPTTTATVLASFGITDSLRTEFSFGRGSSATPRDSERVTTLAFPAAAAARRDVALWAVRVRALEPTTGSVPAIDIDSARAADQPLALVQGGDLAIHVKGSARDGLAAFVTRRSDGAPVADARVTLFDSTGAVRATARTDVAGLITLTLPPLAPAPSRSAGRPAVTMPRRYQPPTPALVEVAAGTARIVQPLDQSYARHVDVDLSPYRLGAAAGPGVRLHGLLYTDRDYYRPGEWVHLAAIARDGLLGALHPPAPGDSAHLTVTRRGAGFMTDGSGFTRDTVLRLDAFGTLVDSLRVAPSAPLDVYTARLELWRNGAWRHIAAADYHVAEYRAPEFAVDVAVDSAPHLLGDTVHATVDAHLLFDAPMPGATLRWRSTLTETETVTVPGVPARWAVGGRDWSSFGAPDPGTRSRPESHDGTITLAGRGPARVSVATTRALFTRPATLRVDAAVTDLNRQTVTQTAAITIHAARLYLAAHDSADAWTWQAGVPRTIRVMAVRPDGRAMGNVRFSVSVVSARWQQDSAHYERGRWITDTLSRDSAITPAVRPGSAVGDTTAAVSIRITPPRAGALAIVLHALDENGRPATTVLNAWATGAGEAVAWWQRDTPVRLPIFATRQRLAPGDSAEVSFTSPFPNATAWITVERERVLRSWSIPAARGPHTLRVPVSAADAPNVYVGVTLIPRGADARASNGAPASVDQRLRTGYVPVDIRPNTQQLTLTIAPRSPTYAPGDSARLAIHVTDAAGRGVPARVMLWAVDAGVLALGDYHRPAPVASLYTHEGLGWTLSSTLAQLGAVTPPWLAWFQSTALGNAMYNGIQIRGMSAPSVRRRRSGDQVEVASPLPAPPPLMGSTTPRSDFRSTAFFLGGVRTDATGRAEASAQLPENLTTFRVVAVAASAGDAYGGADTALVATKPLTIRAALPRFVRTGDSVVAGAVVTWRDTAGSATARLPVQLHADASASVALLTRAGRDTSLAPGGSAELRWAWRVAPDTGLAHVRFTAAASPDVRSAPRSDAVLVTVPVRAAYLPRVFALTGTLPARSTGSDTVRLALPGGLDLSRSRLDLSAGPTPAPAVRAAVAQLAAYPYDCTEQLTSLGRGLVALLQLSAPRPDSASADARERLQSVADALVRRQRADGAFGYWSKESWSTAWLSAESGRLLLDASAVGTRVEGAVTMRLRAYLADTVGQPLAPRDSLFGTAIERRAAAARLLAGRTAALAYLRRVGAPDPVAERALIARARELAWEDRVSLTMLLAARGDSAHAAALLDTLWRGVGRAGARAELGDSLLRTAIDFPSHLRPPARLLVATRVLRPNHPRLGELAAQLQQRARSERGGRWWAWNTQDLAAAAEGLAAVAGARGPGVAGAPISLVGLVSVAGDHDVLTVHVARGASTAPTFYALTVHAVPSAPAGGTAKIAARARTARDDAGITVERWVEPLDPSAADSAKGGAPHAIGDIAAGALVRVRLRVTVPADREFVALEDPLPAGLEAVDLTLRTSGTLAPFLGHGASAADAVGGGDESAGDATDEEDDAPNGPSWRGWARWGSPWEHTEQRDDAVRWFARQLSRGTYTVSYVARATTAGRFVRVPAHAEEMYDPALTGRTEGGTLIVRDRAPRLAVAPR